MLWSAAPATVRLAAPLPHLDGRWPAAVPHDGGCDKTPRSGARQRRAARNSLRRRHQRAASLRLRAGGVGLGRGDALPRGALARLAPGLGQPRAVPPYKWVVTFYSSAGVSTYSRTFPVSRQRRAHAWHTCPRARRRHNFKCLCISPIDDSTCERQGIGDALPGSGNSRGRALARAKGPLGEGAIEWAHTTPRAPRQADCRAKGKPGGCRPKPCSPIQIKHTIPGRPPRGGTHFGLLGVHYSAPTAPSSSKQ